MNLKQLIKEIKKDTKMYLKTKDGKNYIQFLKKQKENENLVVVKGVN
jgi:hypothetical protein